MIDCSTCNVTSGTCSPNHTKNLKTRKYPAPEKAKKKTTLLQGCGSFHFLIMISFQLQLPVLLQKCKNFQLPAFPQTRKLNQRENSKIKNGRILLEAENYLASISSFQLPKLSASGYRLMDSGFSAALRSCQKTF